MPRIRDVIRRLFPKGTNRPEPGSLASFPVWPPDLFALAATLVNWSGCYARPHYVGGGARSLSDDHEYLPRLRATVEAWSRSWTPAGVPELQRLWQTLLDHRNDDVCSFDAGAQVWWDAALQMLAIADEACSGIGFFVDRRHPFAEYYLHVYEIYQNWKRRQTEPVPYVPSKDRRWADKLATVNLPYIPISLCLMVPPAEACVQPKTMTPQVGCTLRSLSHNLALLPPAGEVLTRWEFAAHAGEEQDQLNVLLVPFPYRIPDGCIAPGIPCVGSKDSRWCDGDNRSRFFEVKQCWLGNGEGSVTAGHLTDFLSQLIWSAAEQASQDGRPRPVHAVVLPELALDAARARAVARELARRHRLEFFICGTAATGEEGGANNRNSVYASVFIEQEVQAEWEQSKHHRWRLERTQLERYKLDGVLAPDAFWWERIDLAPRYVDFRVFRHGATLATLICEDLARIDPVQGVIRSVGPNLVVALLMDGPQKDFRWPARYATVLADDPGSAVISLTSLGLIRRENGDALPEQSEVALWKDPTTRARTLLLPRGAHAVLLHLSYASAALQFTLDGRSDQGATRGLTYQNQYPIRHPAPPEWIDMPG